MNELLNNFCNAFGFRYDFIGIYIRIISKRDTWYFKDREYKPGEKIKLYHANAYGKAGMHFQKDCKNIVCVFSYINKHDNKYMVNNKMDYTMDKLMVV